MSTKTLREKRAGVWAQMQEIRDAVDKDGWTAELRASWDKADAELTDLTADIEREERSEKLDKSFADVDERTAATAGKPSDGTGSDDAANGDAYRSAFTAYLRNGLQDLTAEQRQLIQANFRNDPQLRAQGVSTGGAGGYTVPEGFWNKVTETMKWYGGILQAGVEVLDTDNGQDIPWPTNDDTGNVGALLSENTQVPEQDLAFAGKTLGAYMYTSKLVRVSLQLLQDSAIDIESFVARKLGERLGRILNQHWTTGDAANKPQGLITGVTVGKTTGGATAITVNEIIDLIHSVDVAYRNGPGVGFMLHDLVLAYVRKIRDDSGGAGLGRPIWEPSVQAGQPDTLYGYPVTVNNDMASSVATTNKTMAFGSFRAAYVARRVSGAQLMRLAERYADFLQVGFFGFQRADGIVQDASAVKVLQQA